MVLTTIRIGFTHRLNNSGLIHVIDDKIVGQLPEQNDHDRQGAAGHHGGQHAETQQDFVLHTGKSKQFVKWHRLSFWEQRFLITVKDKIVVFNGDTFEYF